MKYLLLILIAFLHSSCCWLAPKGLQPWIGGCDICYGGYGYDYTHYTYKKTDTTQKGIAVDASMVQTVNLARIDERVDKIEACLRPLLRQYSHLTEDQRKAWGCWPRDYKDEPLKRNCFAIKLVPPVQGCMGWDMLPDRAPDQGCIDKGLTPTVECPCRWREVIQGDSLIVTTSTRMPLWDLVSIVTGCAGPGAWNSPFAKCMGEGVAY